MIRRSYGRPGSMISATSSRFAIILPALPEITHERRAEKTARKHSKKVYNLSQTSSGRLEGSTAIEPSGSLPSRGRVREGVTRRVGGSRRFQLTSPPDRRKCTPHRCEDTH